MYTNPQVGNAHDPSSQLHLAEKVFKLIFEGAAAGGH
jgi:hypothetical protein